MNIPSLLVTRRRFITRVAQLSTTLFALPWIARAAAPIVKILETKIISQQPEFYNGWSTVARRQNGDLWVSWSGGRESHVDPFGQVHSMTSHDDGATWTWPRVLLDSITDDRDSGVLETAKGTLIVTTFTSLAYELHLKSQSIFADHKETGWVSQAMPPEQLAKWRSAHARLSDDERNSELGEWLIRSTDGGRAWSERIPTLVNSPHGPIQLKDGRLLYAGKKLWSEDRKIGVAVSSNDGLTWEWLSEIPTRKGDKGSSYHELHAVETTDGTLIVHVRNHNEANKFWTLQTESIDGGQTWSELHPICYGFPSHLLRLRNGDILMSYGYRKKPYGNRTRISTNHGKTWGDELIISADGIDGDLGYPSTVELADGTLLTVWYESLAKPKLAVLRQSKWRIG